jgi:hypothetical protein
MVCELIPVLLAPDLQSAGTYGRLGITPGHLETTPLFCFLRTAYGHFAAMAYIQILFPTSWA